MNGLPRWRHWGNNDLLKLAGLQTRVTQYLQDQRYTLDAVLTRALKDLNLVPDASKKGLQNCLTQLQQAQHVLAGVVLRDTMALDELLDDSDTPVIREVTRTAYAAPATCLLEALAPDPVADRPALLTLAHLLEGEAAQALGTQLLGALDWYGQYSDETPSALMTYKLLLKALTLDLDPKGTLRDFDFEQPALQGMAVSGLRDRITDHHMKGLAAHYRPLVAWLLTAHLPVELQVPDVPAHLAWRRSNLWVHLNQGTQLAELIEPGSAVRIGFQGLCRYASQLASQDDEAAQPLLAITLVRSLREWGIANGLLTPLEKDSPAALQRVMSEFSQREEELALTVEHLQQPPPDRLAMARQVLKQRAIDPDSRFLRRPEKPWGDELWRAFYRNPSFRHINALDVVAASKALGTPADFVPAHVQGHDGTFYPAFMNMHGLPDVAARFEREFAPWLAQSRKACGAMIRLLLSDLPKEQRAPLFGEVTVLVVRKFEYSAFELLAGLVGLLYRELVDRVSTDHGQYGFMLQARHQGRLYYYEVLPYAGLIRLRPELQPLPIYDPSLRVDRNDKWELPIDANAYLTGSAPRTTSSVDVALERLLTLEAIATDTLTAKQAETYFDDLTSTLAERVGEQFMFKHAQRLHLKLRGQTAFDQAHPAKKVTQVFIPFWGAAEDWNEGLATGDRGQLRWAALGLGLETAGLAVPAARITALSVRTARIGARLGLQASLPALRNLVAQTSLSIADQFNPAGLALMLPKALSRIGKTGRSALRWLKRKRSLPVLRPASTRPLRPTPGVDYRRQSSDYRLRRLDDGQSLILYRSQRKGERARLFMIAPDTGGPCGRALTRTADNGGLLRRPPGQIPLEFDEASQSWILRDTTPQLTQHWMAWGDDLYLSAGSVIYRKTTLASGTTVLRRVHSRSLSRALDDIQVTPCRVKRGDPMQMICGPSARSVRNTSHTNTSPGQTEGSDFAPWFTDRRITAGSRERLVHGQQVWRIEENTLKHVRHLSPNEYSPQVTCRILGGNDRFKQIEIDCLVQAIDDTRRISAVVVPRRSDETLVLITRADDLAYYRADYRLGQQDLTLTRIASSPPQATARPGPLTEDDALHYIYNGAYDANHLLRSVVPAVIDQNISVLASRLTADHRKWLKRYISGPFVLDTTPEQAALYCHYTQRKLVLRARGDRDQWHSITEHTPEALRARIAADLNAIHGSHDRFTAANLLLAGTTRQMATAPKNLAYVRLAYKDPGRPDAIYYSLSGFQKPEFDLTLSRRMAMADREGLEPGWRLTADSATAPDGTRFINAQFRPQRTGQRNPPDQELLFLPDLNNMNRLEELSEQRRMFDSERMILARLNKDITDFSSVNSILVFSMKPTCQSCTVGLSDLRGKVAPGKFQVVEGALP
ncbi:hypothetical protein PMM47T1_11067 [Pseudomonas sp. M47T1]|uniref:hypothetical protein n=1 Tax=Pseudomonas sp. M47T1 TaxID=1179778 RepID=UPI0002608008|nr:hypothetical protein [Pseudomonas sp. M47T1]EIK96463.1 hypothetical protein PMM47T1_11067 [Pseudomonas sp. M47T1]